MKAASSNMETGKKTKYELMMEKLARWREQKQKKTTAAPPGVKKAPLKEVNKATVLTTTNRPLKRPAGEVPFAVKKLKIEEKVTQQPKDVRLQKRPAGDKGELPVVGKKLKTEEKVTQQPKDVRQQTKARPKIVVQPKVNTHNDTEELRNKLEEWKKKREEEKKAKSMGRQQTLPAKPKSNPVRQIGSSVPKSRPAEKLVANAPKVQPSRGVCLNAPKTARPAGLIPKDKSSLKRSSSMVAIKGKAPVLPPVKFSRSASSTSNLLRKTFSPKTSRDSCGPQESRRRSYTVVKHHSSTASHKVAALPGRRSTIVGTLRRASVSASSLRPGTTKPFGSFQNKRHSLSSSALLSDHQVAAPWKSILKTPHKAAEDIIMEESETSCSPTTPPLEHLSTGVRFTIPNRTPNTTGKRQSLAPATPTVEMSRRERLNEWLLKRGQTPTRYRHLCCFDEAVSQKKSQSRLSSGLSTDELSHQQSMLGEEAQDDLTVPPKAPSGKTQQKEELNHLLDECSVLFEAGCPTESIKSWLDAISTNYQEVFQMAAYWICRVRIAVDEEDDHAAIDIFEQAYRNNAQPPEKVAAALKEFMVRMQERSRAHQLAAHTPRRAPEVQPKNAFNSSAVKYCLTETTPFFKRLRGKADGSETRLAVVTPVRRSTRRSTANLPNMLQDHDVIIEDLEDIPASNRASTLFRPNEALESDESDSEGMFESEPETGIHEDTELTPYRSLEAEFEEVADN